MQEGLRMGDYLFYFCQFSFSDDLSISAIDYILIYMPFCLECLRAFSAH